MDENRKALVVGAGALAAVMAGAALRGRAAARGKPVVLIAGGSRQRSTALAREFERDGCQVALCSSNGAATFECDVTNREQVEDVVRQVTAQFGRIDVLINSGAEPGGAATLRSAMDALLWGTVYPAMAVVPGMVKRKEGRIVNVSSIGGNVAIPDVLPHLLAKLAAAAFSEGLRAELAGTGVKVATIAPGLMRDRAFRNGRFTTDSGYAARGIVEAARRGKAATVLSIPAKWLGIVHELLPGVSSQILRKISRL